MSDLRGIRLKPIRSSHQDSSVTFHRHCRKTSLHLVTNEASFAEIMSMHVNNEYACKCFKGVKTTLPTEAQNID